MRKQVLHKPDLQKASKKKESRYQTNTSRDNIYDQYEVQNPIYFESTSKTWQDQIVFAFYFCGIFKGGKLESY